LSSRTRSGGIALGLRLFRYRLQPSVAEPSSPRHPLSLLELRSRRVPPIERALALVGIGMCGRLGAAVEDDPKFASLRTDHLASPRPSDATDSHWQTLYLADTAPPTRQGRPSWPAVDLAAILRFHHVNLGVPFGGANAEAAFLLDFLAYQRVELTPMTHPPRGGSRARTASKST
jgi:hypothetical protein